MTDFLFFDTTNELSEKELKKFCRDVLNAQAFEWEDRASEIFPDAPGTTDVYVISRTGKGQFCFHYELYVKNQLRERTKRERIDLLIQLSTDMGAEILVSDEAINPYTYIHIEPGGHASSVGIDVESINEKDELTLGEIFNYPLGGFNTETPLTEMEMAVLDELASHVVPSYEFSSWEIQKMNNDFTHNKERFPQLRNYRHYYLITPKGKSKWYSNDEKAGLLVDMMNAFYQQTKKIVCLIPADSVTIRNIPGGSDHEAYCININEFGSERIVYKDCRERW